MAKKDETTMTMSVNGGPRSAPFTGKDLDRVGRKLAVDLDQHDRLKREDEAVGEYLRLDAEKTASMAAYNERLKALWEEIQACYHDVHDPQRGLPLEPGQ
jgi:hypothetical protein